MGRRFTCREKGKWIDILSPSRFRSNSSLRGQLVWRLVNRGPTENPESVQDGKTYEKRKEAEGENEAECRASMENPKMMTRGVKRQEIVVCDGVSSTRTRESAEDSGNITMPDERDGGFNKKGREPLPEGANIIQRAERGAHWSVQPKKVMILH